MIAQRRNLAIASSVVAMHLVVLWALQAGLLRRAVEIIVPAELISEVIAPAPRPSAPPTPTPTPPTPPPPPAPPKPAQAPRQVQAAPPAPQPVGIADPAPSPRAPVGVSAPQPPASPIAAPVAPEAVPPTPLAPAPVSRIEPPVIDADYVANADAFRPPPVSRRLGEYGTVLLRVTISAEGRASRVELLKSSGYPRLDEAAMNGARQTRFKPATRDGKPVEFAYNWPVKYDPS